MLVLSRKQDETIIIDDNIHVTIVRCGRGQVKIGIEAPDDVSIKRGELVDLEERRVGLRSRGGEGPLSQAVHYAAECDAP